MDESMSPQELERVLRLLNGLTSYAREDRVTLTTLSPYVEVDGRPIGELEYDDENKTYRLRPLMH